MTLVSSLKSVGLISETVTIIKRTEELKCFIWHWIITYVRNNDVRDTCFKKSSLTGPLFFFSLCLLPFLQFHLGKFTWMPKSEKLGKSEKNKLPSWVTEKWQTSRLMVRNFYHFVFVSCPLSLKHWKQLSACCPNLLSDKMQNFFVSHSDMKHLNMPKSEGRLDWEQLAWLGLTNTSKTQ